MVADSAEPGKAQPDDGRFGVTSIFAGRLAAERLGSTPLLPGWISYTGLKQS
ncbi:hypothetical protein EMIT0P43_40005 [Pseudomonas jessenii]